MKRTEYFFTREQSRLVDKLAIAAGIPSLELMENAASRCVEELIKFEPVKVLICAGPGNNGGDGFAMARMLSEKEVSVEVLSGGPFSKTTGDAQVNLQRLKNECDVKRTQFEDVEDGFENFLGRHRFDWIVDAMLGTGASGDPRSPYGQIIREVNSCDARVIGIDIPSGLDCDTGIPGNPTIMADLTCTFVTQKIGFQVASALPYLGEIRVIDIGVPQEMVDQIAAGHSGDTADGS